MNWLKRKLIQWFGSTECPKESLGYTCRHRDGECGYEEKN